MPNSASTTADRTAPAPSNGQAAAVAEAEQVDPSRSDGAEGSPAGPPPGGSETQRESHSDLPRFVIDPLAPYKGMVRRFFIVFQHVLGLLLGGIVAWVSALPPERKRGLRSPFSRTAAFLARLFVKDELRDETFPVQLRRRLEMLGPTYVKLGQIMSIREDLLPDRVTNELSNLLDRLPEIPFAEVRAIIERSLERPLHSAFRHIDEEPLAAASIAQAHKAVTHDGDEVVVKVIKPGITDTIESDLRLLGIVGYLLDWVFPRYRPRRIINEFSAYTTREVDYNYEADNAETFAANFQDVEQVVFPTIHRNLSASDVLTMQYLDGLKPGSAQTKAMDEDEREEIIDLGAASIIRMLFKDGFFHADLHAGNLMVLPPEAPGDDVRVGFIDLGMAGRFEPKTKRQLLYYFRALVNGDDQSAARYLTALADVAEDGDPQGFRRAVSDLSRRFQMRSRQGSVSLAQLILESLNLGRKYRVFFPVEMTLMVKALVTFEGVGRALDPDLNVSEVSRKHVTDIFQDRFNPQAVIEKIARDTPEMLDVLMRLPQLAASGVTFLEEQLSDRRPQRPLAGLRSGILAGSCLIAGALVVVQGGPILLWIAFFLAAILLAIFGG
jgi:ubiquinone biosynthesis protein